MKSASDRQKLGDRLRSAEAFCLRKVDYSETSQIAIFLTDKWGKVSVIAKGSKRSKNATLFPVEPFFLYSIKYSNKAPLHLSILTSINMVKSYFPITQNYKKYLTACDCLRICNLLVPDDQPCRENFNLLAQTLDHILEAQEPLTMIKLGFLAKILHETGYQPNLLTCLECKHKISSRSIIFCFDAGSAICANCHKNQSNCVQFELKTAYLLDYLRQGKINQANSFEKETWRQATFLLEKHLEFVIEKRFTAMKR